MHVGDQLEQPAEGAAAHDAPAVPPRVAWAVMLALGLAVWLFGLWFARHDARVPAWGWRLLAVFAPTILGLMLRPLPGGALVLLALTATIILDALPPAPPGLATDRQKSWAYEQALGGYVDASVWLVLAAFFLSRALIK